MKNSQENKEQSAGHILIVEDDTFMSGLLIRRFSSENFKVSSVSNAQQAREILAKNNILLVILDIVLPGTDGITFLKELKQDLKFNHLPIVIASNLGQPEEIEAGIKGGAAGYIVKSNSSPGEIVEKVKSILKVNY